MSVESLNADKLVGQIATELRQYLNDKHLDSPAMVGIHTGGVWVAQHLHESLALEQPLGTLDINFYRDDFSRKGLHPEVKPSNLPFTVDDQHILLIDDVLHTGRTIRAAMNEIFDYGRPAGIHLIALVERSGRELPVQPDICGHHFNLAPSQQIKLTGPDPLALEILEY
jgi:pyrimidine operon attenuation protein/uracil phosphoribosyltransferase